LRYLNAPEAVWKYAMASSRSVSSTGTGVASSVFGSIKTLDLALGLEHGEEVVLVVGE
jgi:hypothetical protein